MNNIDMFVNDFSYVFIFFDWRNGAEGREGRYEGGGEDYDRGGG